jgi:hypothetical protein
MEQNLFILHYPLARESLSKDLCRDEKNQKVLHLNLTLWAPDQQKLIKQVPFFW